MTDPRVPGTPSGCMNCGHTCGAHNTVINRCEAKGGCSCPEWSPRPEYPPTGDKQMSDGITLIAQERKRQVEAEGFTPEHDEQWVDGELSGAGASYATAAHRQIGSGVASTVAPPAQTWRFSREWWKPTGDPVRDLVKAGALIAAEIDRCLRERAGAAMGDIDGR